MGFAKFCSKINFTDKIFMVKACINHAQQTTSACTVLVKAMIHNGVGIRGNSSRLSRLHRQRGTMSLDIPYIVR